MAKNMSGGGSQTNVNGLGFEQETDLKTALIKAGYSVRGSQVYAGDSAVALLAGKHDLYRLLLEPKGVEWECIISKQMFPDEALYVYSKSTVYIIEKKFQNGAGSVDEKLQTCDFKKKQYQKLFNNINIRVEYGYVCNDYFKKPAYRDVFEYIKSVGCYYCFNEIPIAFLHLPKL